MSMMRLTRIVILSAALLLAANASAETLYDLVASGQLDEVADSLSVAVSAASRDGDLLFIQALVQTDAERAAQLLTASLNAAVSPEYREEVLYRLAQYHHARGDNVALAQIVNQYRTSYEQGRFASQMRRLAIIADEQAGKRESALRQLDRLLVRSSATASEQWATIDKARIMMASGKRVGAVELLRSISRDRTGPGASQALYLLALDALENGRYDDAVFYYNLLREAYPSAIGLGVLIDKLGNASASRVKDNTAEELTGTFYSVKVGVFSQKENAYRQRDIFKAYDKKVEVKSKSISGKKYHVVYVGRFSSYDAADRFKDTLESNHGEVYQVVTR